MFIVILKLSGNRDRLTELLEAHNAWVRNGIESGVFLLVGTLEPRRGGVILAQETSLEAIEKRVHEDPFVREGVVDPEVLQVSPARADPRLQFLL